MIVENNIFFRFLNCESDNHAMNCRFASPFATPFEGSVSENDLDMIFDNHLLPEYTHLFSLCYRIGRNESDFNVCILNKLGCFDVPC